jgi:hypothetical protein
MSQQHGISTCRTTRNERHAMRHNHLHPHSTSSASLESDMTEEHLNRQLRQVLCLRGGADTSPSAQKSRISHEFRTNPISNFQARDQLLLDDNKTGLVDPRVYCILGDRGLGDWPDPLQPLSLSVFVPEPRAARGLILVPASPFTSGEVPRLCPKTPSGVQVRRCGKLVTTLL